MEGGHNVSLFESPTKRDPNHIVDQAHSECVGVEEVLPPMTVRQLPTYHHTERENKLTYI